MQLAFSQVLKLQCASESEGQEAYEKWRNKPFPFGPRARRSAFYSTQVVQLIHRPTVFPWRGRKSSHIHKDSSVTALFPSGCKSASPTWPTHDLPPLPMGKPLASWPVGLGALMKKWGQDHLAEPCSWGLGALGVTLPPAPQKGQLSRVGGGAASSPPTPSPPAATHQPFPSGLTLTSACALGAHSLCPHWGLWSWDRQG